ncbi:MAG: thymidylate kinase, partial [Christensenellales bacterium]
MGKTKVIAIEGIDGSGKSVQYNKLAEALTDMGYSVEKREYPKYESYFGSHVGSYLSGAEGVKADTVDGKSMALWFALDRWEDMRSHIDGEYDYMIINRYVLS